MFDFNVEEESDREDWVEFDVTDDGLGKLKGAVAVVGTDDEKPFAKITFTELSSACDCESSGWLLVLKEKLGEPPDGE